MTFAVFTSEQLKRVAADYQRSAVSDDLKTPVVIQDQVADDAGVWTPSSMKQLREADKCDLEQEKISAVFGCKRARPGPSGTSSLGTKNNLIYWLRNAVIAEKSFNSLK